MASATLSFSTSLLNSTQIHQNPFPLSLSKPTFPFHFPSSPSSSPQGLKFSPVITWTPGQNLTLPKNSVSESQFVAETEEEETGFDEGGEDEDEDDVSAEEAEELLEASKREEIFAVVMVGSRQYIVFPGRWIHTQRLKGANVNDKIVLNKVLLVSTRTTTWIGKPIVTNAAVHAIVEEQLLDKKKIVFKYKKKKNYKRNIGHRQPITRIRITAITGYEGYPSVHIDSLKTPAESK